MLSFFLYEKALTETVALLRISSESGTVQARYEAQMSKITPEPRVEVTVSLSG